MNKLMIFTFVSLCILFTGVSTIEVSAMNSMNLEYDDIDGRVVETTGNNFSTLQGNSEKIENLTLSYENGSVTGEGVIEINDSTSVFEFKGDLFPVKGGGVRDNDVIGDIHVENSNFNILQFQLKNDVHILSIVIEDIENEVWVEFEIPLEKQHFASFYEGSELNMSQNVQEHGETVIPLLNKRNKSQFFEEEHPKTDSVSIEGSSSSDDQYENLEPQQSQLITEVSRALDDVKRLGTIHLDDYNIPNSVFGEDGWQNEEDQDIGIGFHKYSSGDSFTTVTQISYYSLFGDFTQLSDTVERFDLSVNLFHGVVVELNHDTNQLDLFYYDWGLEKRDADFGLYGLEDENVFRNQTLNGGGLTQTGGNGVIQFLIGLAPAGGSINDFLSINRDNGSDILGNTIGFGQVTYEDQLAANGAIKGIRATASNHILQNEGGNFTFQGEIHTPTGYISLYWTYNRTARTSL